MSVLVSHQQRGFSRAEGMYGANGHGFRKNYFSKMNYSDQAFSDDFRIKDY
jgi:hypothetical protein